MKEKRWDRTTMRISCGGGKITQGKLHSRNNMPVLVVKYSSCEEIK
jgi:hypothetical protein